MREELGRRRADNFEDFDHHVAGRVDADEAALAPGVIAQGIDDVQARLQEPGLLVRRVGHHEGEEHA